MCLSSTLKAQCLLYDLPSGLRLKSLNFAQRVFLMWVWHDYQGWYFPSACQKLILNIIWMNFSMRKHQGPVYSLFRGLLATSEHVLGTSYDRVPRHRFSCVSGLHENVEMVPKLQVATMCFSLFVVKRGNIGTLYGSRRLLSCFSCSVSLSQNVTVL